MRGLIFLIFLFSIQSQSQVYFTLGHHDRLSIGELGEKIENLAILFSQWTAPSSQIPYNGDESSIDLNESFWFAGDNRINSPLLLCSELRIILDVANDLSSTDGESPDKKSSPLLSEELKFFLGQLPFKNCQQSGTSHQTFTNQELVVMARLTPWIYQKFISEVLGEKFSTDPNTRVDWHSLLYKNIKVVVENEDVVENQDVVEVIPAPPSRRQRTQVH